jgi:hypothetical protein
MNGFNLRRAIVLLLFALFVFKSLNSSDSSITCANINQDKLDDADYTGEIPDEFICPITGAIMDEPAYFEGDEQAVHRFEERALIKWNTEQKKAHTFQLTFQLKHPWTNRPVDIENIKIDSELKDEIEQFVDEVTDDDLLAHEEIHRPLF